jgi:hypothetical protein
VIPDFLLPGRKYPIHVYIFAINLYSTKAELSQRDVAEATRKEFGLSKFSHSTVCRVLKALEKSIAAAIEKPECKREPDKATIEGRDANRPAMGEKVDKKRAFPSVCDTKERREAMVGFLGDISARDEKGGIAGASRRIVKKWYDKYRRLLL